MTTLEQRAALIADGEYDKIVEPTAWRGLYNFALTQLYEAVEDAQRKMTDDLLAANGERFVKEMGGEGA